MDEESLDSHSHDYVPKRDPLMCKPPRPGSAGSSRGSLSLMQKRPAGTGYRVNGNFVRGEDDAVAKIAPYSVGQTFLDGDDPDVHLPKLGRSISLISQANTDTWNPIYSTRSYDTLSSSKRYSDDVSAMSTSQGLIFQQQKTWSVCAEGVRRLSSASSEHSVY